MEYPIVEIVEHSENKGFKAGCKVHEKNKQKTVLINVQF